MTTRSPSSARSGAAGRMRSTWKRYQLTKQRICLDCPARLTPKNATVDHIVPLSRGGLEGPTNYRLVCHACNSARREQLFSPLVGG